MRAALSGTEEIDAGAIAKGLDVGRWLRSSAGPGRDEG